ncbi:MAG: peptidoglycan-binding protein [Candidatus Omnitrophica bacterium]|nr:peptidoglycan-binding protein [Candidatus Omnitrophota bacterium]
MWRLLSCAVCLLFLVGCATSQPPLSTGNMAMKYRKLERRVDDSDEEIKLLQEEIRQLKDLLESYENYQLADTLGDSIRFKLDDGSFSSSRSKTSSSKSSSLSKLVRVPVRHATIQKALKEAGYYKGPIDGKIGSMSKKAIQAFQKDHGLKPDGVVGQRTWNELKNYL